MKKYLEIYPKTWKNHGILSDRNSGNPDVVTKTGLYWYNWPQAGQIHVKCLQKVFRFEH